MRAHRASSSYFALSVVFSVGSVVIAGALGACGGEAPPPVVAKPATPPPPPPAPPPQRAKWVFAHPELGMLSRYELEDGRTVYAGRAGRRAAAKAGDPLVDAPQLALDDLIAILRDDKGQFVYVGEDGDAYAAKEPLGVLDAARPGPLAGEVVADQAPPKLISPTTGKASILGLDPKDRHLLRSGDFGLHWGTVDYGGAKSIGRATSLALDGKGNGLLLQLPQKLFLTKDDGATWSPISSPGIGAVRVSRDGASRIFLEGYGYKFARLEGDKLVETSEHPAAMFTVPPPKTSSPPTPPKPGSRETHSMLVGDHVVEVTKVHYWGSPHDEVEVGAARIGETPAKMTRIADLSGTGSLSRNFAAYRDEIIYARGDDDGDTTTILRSKDFGQSWQLDATLTGKRAGAYNDARVIAGPKGWVYVPSLCPATSYDVTKCSLQQVRPAGAHAFEDLAFVEEFAPRKFAFDESHDRVYVLGDHRGRLHVYESKLAENKFTRTKLLDMPGSTTATITVDQAGTLRVLAFDGENQEWVLRRRDGAGTEQPALWIPLSYGHITMTGSRGFAITGNNHGWETADGGETWHRVGAYPYDEDLECGTAGCVMRSAQRVGWDLPAYEGEQKLTAQTEPLPKKVRPPVPPTPKPPTTNVDLTCKLTGTATKINATPMIESADAHAGEHRWFRVQQDVDQKVTIAVATRNAVKETVVFPALAKPKIEAPKAATGGTAVAAPTSAIEHRTAFTESAAGAIMVRYTFDTVRGPTGDYNPVDVEIAWLSNKTGKLSRGTVKKVPSFRVGRFGLTGAFRIVDGGIVFQPNWHQPLHFIHDDGKVESIDVKGLDYLGDVLHLGKRWLFANYQSGNVRLLSSDDGKTWNSKAWGLSASGSLLVGELGGAPFVRAWSPDSFFSLEGAIGDDPPAPTMIDNNADASAACAANVGTFGGSYYGHSRNIRLKVDPPKGETAASYWQGRSLVHLAPGGGRCTAVEEVTGEGGEEPMPVASLGYGGGGYGGGYGPGYGYGYASYGHHQTVYLYQDKKGWYAWRFKQTTDDKGASHVMAQPMTCTPGTAM